MIPSVGFIPSPAHGIVHIGPLPLHAYGLMLALGVLAAAKIAERRWVRQGNDPREIGALAVPVVIGGVVGARVYHLFTGYDWSKGGLVGTVQVWRGGLSIWGAVLGGLVVLVVVARRRDLDLLALMDAIAPAVLIGQAIGRFGNYFNQELFGRPTALPWGLEIDLAHRPAGFTQYATFHPTFLYESMWCLLVFGIIVLAERRIGLRKGQAFALYICLYTLGRAEFEVLRIDKATRVFGIRFNLLVSAALCIGGAVWFVVLARRSPPGAKKETPLRGSPQAITAHARNTPRGMMVGRSEPDYQERTVGTVALTEATFEQTIAENDIVLVDWWASWCGPCRMFAPVFDAAAAQHTDIVFAKIDTETEQALAGMAGIMSIPTLMAFREGVLIFAQPGALPGPALEDLITQVRALDMEVVRDEIGRQTEDSRA